MDTGDSKLTAFIDNKYIPMDSKIKLAVAIVVLLIPIVLFFFVFYQPSSADISRLKAESKKKRDEISRLKTTENNLDLFREQTAAEKEKFELAVTKLPSQKEIPQLLKDISALGRNAGLEFLTFAPRPHTERNF
ncbi:MAG: pilus assembly protein PilO, partial [Desulfobulbaceae bacterium]